MKLNQFFRGLAALALMVSLGANAAMIKGNQEAMKVDARGLDLATQQGQEILYHRLQLATKKICGTTSVHEAGSLARALSNRSCFNETLSKAVESVGNTGLADIHKTS